MALNLEELVARVLTFLEKELNDPAFMAELLAFVTALNNWLEAVVKGQGGTPAATPTPGTPAQSAPTPEAQPTYPPGKRDPSDTSRQQANALRPPVRYGKA